MKEYAYTFALSVLVAQLYVSNAQADAPKVPASRVATWDHKLDEGLKALGTLASPPPEDFVLAKGKIREVQTLLTLDPEAKEKPQWESTCSLFVEAALLRLQSIAVRSQEAKDQADRIAVLTELGNSMDEINKLERGYASSLRSDLEEQKRKVQQARDEADKKFNELNSALIQVKKDARGTIISMSDILFAVGKADLSVDLKTSLAKISGILTIYKDANVAVEGHTDNQGSAEFNQKLSEKRAKNVMDFMINPGGIDAKRLTSAGYGFTKPVAENDTKEGRQKNRRVDLVVMDKKPTP